MLKDIFLRQFIDALPQVVQNRYISQEHNVSNQPTLFNRHLDGSRACHFIFQWALHFGLGPIVLDLPHIVSKLIVWLLRE